MIIGSIWFNPRTFFPMWAKAIGKPQLTDMSGGGGGGGAGGMAVVWILVVVASFVQALFMAALISSLGVTGLVQGALTGFLAWLGFVAATSLTNKLFADQLQAWVLEAGNHLVTFLVFGAILGAWQ
jgi:hypothetical protein